MTNSVRVNDLFVNDLALFDVVKFELFCLSEVLEYISVLISYCNPHCFVSFRSYLLVDFYRLILAAAADDQKLLAVNKRVRDLFACAVINRGNGCAGNMHP